MWIGQPLNHTAPPAIYIAAKSVSAQGNTNKNNDSIFVGKLGVCRTFKSIAQGLSIYPTSSADRYFVDYSGAKVGNSFSATGSNAPRLDIEVKFLTEPSHGSVEREDLAAKDSGKYWYKYEPDEDYAGEDHFTIEVVAGNKHIQIFYTIIVLERDMSRVDYCEKESWKISNVPATNDLQTTITFANSIDAAIAQAFTGFTDLPGTSLGQATGPTANITLNLNPAGHG